jgi:hypothetical protein
MMQQALACYARPARSRGGFRRRRLWGRFFAWLYAALLPRL